jgi:alginate O-acetyltransferase complex protein AlgJ
VIRRYRRYWLLPIALLILLPLAVSLAFPNNTRLSTDELRPLAAAPTLPGSLAGWLHISAGLDAYLHDHFGLRHTFIHAYALLSQGLLRSGNSLVLPGRSGWLFYRGDWMILQSAGLIRRDQLVHETADLIVAVQRALTMRQARLVVAPPPNSSTIYPEELPRWARNHGIPTEYDLLLKDLANRGVSFVDLRPVLQAAKEDGKLYHQHDTHWTMRGALIGFNAVAQAAGHPDWRFDAADVLGSPVTVTGGDLARMLGLSADLTESDQLLVRSVNGHRELLAPNPFPAFVEVNNRSGPTVMVVGDSFTIDQFPPLLLQRTGRIVWVHHSVCGFSWKWIDQFHPDEVWWMPTERLLICPPGIHPDGFSLKIASTPP